MITLETLSAFQSFSVDTRTLQKGDVFVALKGPNFDGHKFIEEATKKGAIAAIVSKEISSSIPLIKVNDTFETLTILASNRRNMVKIPIIALTGSCGKTTTKTMLASILSSCGKTLATEENLNNNLGVALTLLKIQAEHQFAVIEVGASIKGEINYSAQMIKPDIAIITNISPVHLEGFDNLDGIAHEKTDLFRNLANKGIAILNADDQYFNYWQKQINRQFVSFGLENKANIYANNVKIEQNGDTSFILHTPKNSQLINLSVIGQHNIKNALAAAAACYAINIPMTKIKIGLETMMPVTNRLIKKQGLHGATIINDTYNANPVAMEAALSVLMLAPDKKMLVFADMGELGSNAEKYHYELGIKARNLGLDNIFTIGKLARITAEAFGEGAFHFDDRNELIKAVRAKLADDVTVLVKGSKSNHLWEIVEQLI